MLQNVNFDFSSFEDVPSPQSRTTYRLTFSAGNKLCQNDAFHRALQGITDFHLQLSSDGHFLRLDPNGPNNLTFTKNGARTHHPLGDMLRRKGLEPPLSYLMCWREDLGCWVGQYDGLSFPCLFPTPRNAKILRQHLSHETSSTPLSPRVFLGQRSDTSALHLQKNKLSR